MRLRGQQSVGYNMYSTKERVKDLTAKELDQTKEDRIRNHSIIIVTIFFGIILTLAFLAEQGNAYI